MVLHGSGYALQEHGNLSGNLFGNLRGIRDSGFSMPFH
jgi:hypothetical protein